MCNDIPNNKVKVLKIYMRWYGAKTVIWSWNFKVKLNGKPLMENFLDPKKYSK